MIFRLCLQSHSKDQICGDRFIFFFQIIILTRSAFAIRKVCDWSQVIGAGCWIHYDTAVLLPPEMKIYHIISTDAILICTAVLQQKGAT